MTRFRPAFGWLLFGTAVLVGSGCGGDDSSATPEETPAEDSAPEVVVPESTDVAEPEPPPEPEKTEPDPPSYDFSAVSPIVEAFVEENQLNGAGLIVVDRDNGVVHQDYWGEFDEDRISLIASSSKMITAGVLLRLQDDGLLDMDAPVADVVEWGAGNPEITPAQLVSNSSGLVGLLPDPGFPPYLCQYVSSGTLQGCAEAIFTTDGDDADVIAPDSEFRYGGAQWQVAGAVAEVASEKSWAQLIDEIYVRPCDLEVLAFNNHFAQLAQNGFSYPVEFNHDPSTLASTDNPNMEGGVYTTTPDYGKLLLMHLRGGVCGETQVLSQDALDALHGDRINAVYGGSASADPDETSEDVGYGMGWWVDRTNDRITDPGAYGSVPWLDLEDGYGAFLLIESDAGTGLALVDELYDVVEEAVTENAS